MAPYFRGEVGLRRSKKIEPRFAVLTEESLDLFKDEADADAGDRSLLRGNVVKEEITSIELDTDCVTLLTAEVRMTLCFADETASSDFVDTLEGWLADDEDLELEIEEAGSADETEQNQALTEKSNSAAEGEDEDDEEEEEEEEEGGSSPDAGESGTEKALSKSLSILDYKVLMCGLLLITGKAERFFVLSSESFAGYLTEAEARDDSTLPFMEMPHDLVNAIESTEDGFQIDFGKSSKTVGFVVPNIDDLETWLDAWESVEDASNFATDERWKSFEDGLYNKRTRRRTMERIKLASPVDEERRLTTVKEESSSTLGGSESPRTSLGLGGAPSAPRGPALSRGASRIAALSGTGSLTSLPAPLEEDEEEAEEEEATGAALPRTAAAAARRSGQAAKDAGQGRGGNGQVQEALPSDFRVVGHFDAALLPPGAGPPAAPGARRRRRVELVPGRLLVFEDPAARGGGGADGDAREKPIVEIALAEVLDVEIPGDTGFLLKVADGSSLELRGPEGGAFDEWLDALEQALTGARPQAPEHRAPFRNLLLDEVLPSVVMPLMAGVLEVALPGESAATRRQVVLQHDQLQIFPDRSDMHTPLVNVSLSGVDQLRMHNNHFELGTQDRRRYTFTAQDSDDFMSWMKSWRSVLESQTDTAYGYLGKEAPLHEGPVYIDSHGVRQVNYAVAYPNRVEFLKEESRRGDRDVERRILWPEDVLRVQITDEGFTIDFAKGPIDVVVPMEENVDAWSDALSQLLRPHPNEQEPRAEAARSADAGATSGWLERRLALDEQRRLDLDAASRAKAAAAAIAASEGGRGGSGGVAHPAAGAADGGGGQRSALRSALVLGGGAGGGEAARADKGGAAATQGSSGRGGRVGGRGGDRGQAPGLAASGGGHGGRSEASVMSLLAHRPPELRPLLEAFVALPPAVAPTGAGAAASSSGSLRYCVLFPDRLDFWYSKDRALAQEEPAGRVKAADIVHVDVDSIGRCLILNCRLGALSDFFLGSSGAVGGLAAAERRQRVQFDSNQELSRWCVAVVAATSRAASRESAPDEPDATDQGQHQQQQQQQQQQQPRKASPAPPKVRRQPKDWLPRVATLPARPKAEGTEGQGRSVVFRAPPNRGHSRAFVVSTNPDNIASTTAKHFEGCSSRAVEQPLAPERRNREIEDKVNPRRPSARLERDRRLTRGGNDARMAWKITGEDHAAKAQKGFTWSKVNHKPDGTLVFVPPRRNTGSGTPKPTDCGRRQNGWVEDQRRRPRVNDLHKTREMSGNKIVHLSFV